MADLSLHMLVLLLVIVSGCDAGDGRTQALARDYRAAVRSADELTEVRTFRSLFPESTNRISHFTQEAGSPVWGSEAGLHGRYILWMEFGIELRDSKVVGITTPPQWVLVEVKEIQRTPAGQLTWTVAKQWNLSRDDWNALAAAEGDFAAIGIKLRKDTPLPEFDSILSPKSRLEDK